MVTKEDLKKVRDELFNANLSLNMNKDEEKKDEILATIASIKKKYGKLLAQSYLENGIPKKEPKKETKTEKERRERREMIDYYTRKGR